MGKHDLQFRKFFNDHVQNIIRKHELSDLLNSLEENASNKIKKRLFSSQLEIIASGYRKFKYSAPSDQELFAFYSFIFTLSGAFINFNSLNLNPRKTLKDSIKNKNIDGFYYELKIFQKLFSDGFKIIKFPEYDKNITKQQGVKTPDAIIEKNGKKFQVECKTIGHEVGHPINKSAFMDFIKLLHNDDFFYGILKKDYDCDIHFSFEKKLKVMNGNEEKCYSPQELLGVFKEHFNSKKDTIKVNNYWKYKTETMSDEESVSSIRAEFINKYEKMCRITLTSSFPNQFAEEILRRIEEQIYKRLQYRDSLPLIFCLEFDECQSLKHLMPCFFTKFFDKLVWVIISDRLPPMDWSSFLKGRMPFEFRTQPMTKYLQG